MSPARRPAPGRPAPAGTGSDSNDQRWREAAQLRAERKGWIVVWLAPENCFKAYRRMPGARRDTALSAATAAEMAGLIGRAEQAARTPPSRKERS
jgi:hypothetical protein